MRRSRNGNGRQDSSTDALREANADRVHVRSSIISVINPENQNQWKTEEEKSICVFL